MVEPVFGLIKQARSFTRHGTDKAKKKDEKKMESWKRMLARMPIIGAAPSLADAHGIG